MANDLFDAVAVVCLGDARLTSGFGRTGYFWSDLAPADDPLPRAVYTDTSRATEDELLQERGDRTVIIAGAFQVVTYSSSRTTARTLGRLVASVLEERAAWGGMPFIEGRLTDLRRSGLETTDRDPDPGPDGNPVWSHLVQFNYSLVEDNT
jgi:hypothetical protein